MIADRSSDASEIALDAQWYDRFMAVGSFQDFSLLDGGKDSRDEQKRLFLEKGTRNPTLDYPKIDLHDLAMRETTLLALKQEIKDQEPNDEVSKIYRWKINVKLAEIAMIQAAERVDDRVFKAYSHFLYGEPNPEIFTYLIESLRRETDQYLQDPDEIIAQAAQTLNKRLPQEAAEIPSIQLPSPKIFSQVRNKVLGEVNLCLLDEVRIEDERDYTPEEICEIFQSALTSISAPPEWTVEIDTGSRAGFMINQDKKTVVVPQSKNFKGRRLKGILVHEIGTHVAGRITGENGPLHLLGPGLDRYEPGEEALATMRAQVCNDTMTAFSDTDRYLSISLGEGLDGIPRDFRGVYEFMYDYFYFKALVADNHSEKAATSAQSKAWNTAVRTFRGTSCETPGCCYTRDLAYAEGNIGLWQSAIKDPAGFEVNNVGRYNLLSDRHTKVLHELGIIED
ncbi:MAG TPA: tyrosine/phenylalanine carboxypeptidase domain-containing protein [Candidatus Gracilibacteria bacterium]